MIKKLYVLLFALSLMAALPMFSMENDITDHHEITSPCDACGTQTNTSLLKEITREHWVNQVTGVCSYRFCDACHEKTQEKEYFLLMYNIPHETVIKYVSCKSCMIVDAHKQPITWKAITYPCDNCHEEKAVLCVLDKTRCHHILCNVCNNEIMDWDKPAVDKIWWDCNHCSYFYHEKNKLCTQTEKNYYGFYNSGTKEAKSLKNQYPTRILPDVTDASIFPENPFQQEPIRQNPDNTDFVVSNKIKWFGAASIAIIACYGVYKWWTGEDAQEKDTDNEQENVEQEEKFIV